MSLELLNLNKQSSQSCVYCGKSYKNTKSLNKHSILCELYYNSKTILENIQKYKNKFNKMRGGNRKTRKSRKTRKRRN